MSSTHLILTRVRELRNAGQYDDCKFLLDASISKTSGSLHDELKAELGFLYLALNKWSNAEELFFEVYNLVESDTEGSTIAKALSLIGLALIDIHKGNHPEALKSIKTAMSLNVEDNNIKVDISLTLSKLMYFTGDLEKSVEILEKTTEIARRETGSYYNLGITYLYLGKLALYRSWKGIQETQDYYLKAEQEFQRADSLYGIALLQYEYGGVNLRCGNLEQAILNYRKCQELARQINNMALETKARHGEAQILAREGKVILALEILSKVLNSSFVKENKYFRAKLTITLGNIYYHNFQDYNCTELFDKAQQLFDELHIQPHILDLLSAKIMLYLDYSNKDSSRLIEQHADIAQSHKTRWGEAYAVYLYATAEEKNDKHSEAVIILKKAFDEALAVYDMNLALNCVQRLILNRMQTISSEETFEELSWAINKALIFFQKEQIKFNIGIIDLLISKALLFVIQKDHQKARDTIEKCLSIATNLQLPYYIAKARQVSEDIKRQGEILRDNYSAIASAALKLMTQLSLHPIYFSKESPTAPIIGLFCYYVDAVGADIAYTAGDIPEEFNEGSIEKLCQFFYQKLTQTKIHPQGLFGPLLIGKSKCVFVYAHEVLKPQEATTITGYALIGIFITWNQLLFDLTKIQSAFTEILGTSTDYSKLISTQLALLQKTFGIKT